MWRLRRLRPGYFRGTMSKALYLIFYRSRSDSLKLYNMLFTSARSKFNDFTSNDDKILLRLIFLHFHVLSKFKVGLLDYLGSGSLVPITFLFIGMSLGIVSIKIWHKYSLILMRKNIHVDAECGYPIAVRKCESSCRMHTLQ